MEFKIQTPAIKRLRVYHSVAKAYKRFDKPMRLIVDANSRLIEKQMVLFDIIVSFYLHPDNKILVVCWDEEDREQWKDVLNFMSPNFDLNVFFVLVLFDELLLDYSPRERIEDIIPVTEYPLFDGIITLDTLIRTKNYKSSLRQLSESYPNLGKTDPELFNARKPLDQESKYFSKRWEMLVMPCSHPFLNASLFALNSICMNTLYMIPRFPPDKEDKEEMMFWAKNIYYSCRNPHNLFEQFDLISDIMTVVEDTFSIVDASEIPTEQEDEPIFMIEEEPEKVQKKKEPKKTLKKTIRPHVKRNTHFIKQPIGGLDYSVRLVEYCPEDGLEPIEIPISPMFVERTLNILLVKSADNYPRQKIRAIDSVLETASDITMVVVVDYTNALKLPIIEDSYILINGPRTRDRLKRILPECVDFILTSPLDLKFIYHTLTYDKLFYYARKVTFIAFANTKEEYFLGNLFRRGQSFLGSDKNMPKVRLLSFTEHKNRPILTKLASCTKLLRIFLDGFLHPQIIEADTPVFINPQSNKCFLSIATLVENICCSIDHKVRTFRSRFLQDDLAKQYQLFETFANDEGIKYSRDCPVVKIHRKRERGSPITTFTYEEIPHPIAHDTSGVLHNGYASILLVKNYAIRFLFSDVDFDPSCEPDEFVGVREREKGRWNMTKGEVAARRPKIISLNVNWGVVKATFLDAKVDRDTYSIEKMTPDHVTLAQPEPIHLDLYMLVLMSYLTLFCHTRLQNHPSTFLVPGAHPCVTTMMLISQCLQEGSYKLLVTPDHQSGLFIVYDTSDFILMGLVGNPAERKLKKFLFKRMAENDLVKLNYVSYLHSELIEDIVELYGNYISVGDVADPNVKLANTHCSINITKDKPVIQKSILNLSQQVVPIYDTPPGFDLPSLKPPFTPLKFRRVQSDP